MTFLSSPSCRTLGRIAAAITLGSPLTTVAQSTPPAIAWSACADLDAPFECATFPVPIDHANPNEGTLQLALARRRASDPAQRIGTLFVDPGGPGGSGVDFIQYVHELYSPEVLSRFDIVGFDPRFVARSQGINCLTDEERDTLHVEQQPSPLTAEEAQVVYEERVQYAKKCAQVPGIEHAGTANVARDLELLREAVGDAQLTYAGYSYGTVIGQMYAAMFPGKLRAMLLDAVVDAAEWSGSEATRARPFSIRKRSALGTTQTMNYFLQQCRAAGEGCLLNALGDPEQVVTNLLSASRSSQELHSSLITAIVQALYDPLEWPMLAGTLMSAARGLSELPPAEAPPGEEQPPVEVPPGDGESEELAAARLKAYALRLSRAPQEASDSDAKYAVSCADSLNPSGADAWWTAAQAEEQRSPYFAAIWTYSGVACDSWKAPAPGSRYSGGYGAVSTPVLIVNNLYDPATPHANAEAVAARLGNAYLVSVDAGGHLRTSTPSECAKELVSSYLIELKTPAAKTTACAGDRLPFAPPEEVRAGARR